MSHIIESFEAVGSDGYTYRIDLWQHPGPETRPVDGPARRLPGSKEYLLSDGRHLIDVSRLEWKIHNTSIRIAKPAER